MNKGITSFTGQFNEEELANCIKILLNDGNWINDSKKCGINPIETK